MSVGMMRYRLRTLLIVLSVGPPMLAVAYFTAWVAWSWVVYSREVPGWD
jgi:hypothetical protein